MLVSMPEKCNKGSLKYMYEIVTRIMVYTYEPEGKQQSAAGGFQVEPNPTQVVTA